MESPFEHLWLQIKSKSSKQSFLLGVLYQPNFDISATSQNHYIMIIKYFDNRRLQNRLNETK